MLASILIIGFSLVLLIYWFRVSCILLLRNSAVQRNAFDQRFSFARVQKQLEAGASFDPLERMLEEDYKLLIYLFEHAAGLQLPALEDRLLVIDYKVMRWSYRLVKAAAPGYARRALAEMASVIGVLVQHMSDQAGLQSEA
jgi:hypothetical protein